MRLDIALAEACQGLDRDSLESPLATVSPDLTCSQARSLRDRFMRIRDAMRRQLRRHALQPPLATTSATAVVGTALDRALAVVAEIEPLHMGGGGPVDDDLEAELARMASQLFELIVEAKDVLAASTQAVAEAPARGAAGQRNAEQLVGELGQVIDTHHLDRLRPQQLALVKRLASSDCTIAFCGHSNAGKSSLINVALGCAVLPVSPIASSVVPVQVRHAKESWGFATYGTAHTEKFALGRLAEFASAQFNPGNARLVTDLRIDLSSERLPPGVALVDMPGFDADTAHDATATREFPPECDAGVVVIDTGTSLTAADAAMIDALDRAGAAVMVVLTKADHLSPEERWKVHGYFVRRIGATTGVDARVHLASSISEEPALRDKWIEEGLVTLIQSCTAARQRCLRTKVDRLCGQTLRALELAGRADVALRPPDSRLRLDVDALLAEGRAQLVAAVAQPFGPRDEALRQTTALIEEVAHNASSLWSEGHARSIDAVTLVQASLHARAVSTAARVLRSLEGLRGICSARLQEAAQALHVSQSHLQVLPSVRNVPVFAEMPRLRATTLPQPRLSILGREWRIRAARSWLQRSWVREGAAEALLRYFNRVSTWQAKVQRDLATAFDVACAELRRASCSGSVGVNHNAARTEAIVRDIDRLRRHRDAMPAEPEIAEVMPANGQRQ